jgi:hypothetical protein
MTAPRPTKNPTALGHKAEITQHAPRYETSQHAKAVGNAKPAPPRLSSKGGRR